MRVLIIGTGGMLGHKLWQQFAGRFDLRGTIRKGHAVCARLPLYSEGQIIHDFDVTDRAALSRLLQQTDPEVVVNCVGMIKQRQAASTAAMISVNALFPHQLADACLGAGARLIHISTDCVFSGREGMYTEASTPDPVDVYGHSKYLGEVSESHCLTLRTSLIGRELFASHGLVEWFLSNDGGAVPGFRRAVFSGVTTLAMSRIVAAVIEQHVELSGVYHVASEPIDKLTLLQMLQRVLKLSVKINSEEGPMIDRSLDDQRFRETTGVARDSWIDMVEEFACDPTPYEEWRLAV